MNQRVKRSFFFIFFISIIAAFSLYNYLTLSPPQIEITPLAYDFGAIPYSQVKKSFTIKNVGGSPLRIKGVSTSCGCTQAMIEKDYLLPKEETTLLVTFDPNLMESEETEDKSGEIYRIIYVRSNDPAHPEVEVEIRARLEEG